MQQGHDHNPIVAFHNRLLRTTFHWCVSNSSFYRERFRSISSFSGLADLHRLPILMREEAVANRNALTCGQAIPACVQYTTGTTGTFLPLYRSTEEVEFISSFYSDRIRETLRPDRQRPLYLALTSNYHGSSTPMPSRAYILSAGVYDRTQAQQAAKLLRHSFDFPGVEPRVSALVGADILIKALTAHVIDEGIDPASLQVRQIVLTGGYLSTAEKQKLAALWKASVHDRLSLSEIFGGAAQLEPGGPWTFDVEVVPEVVHPRTFEPIDQGIGALVLTSLYPFSQMSPMIRYYTGDLVEIVPKGCERDGNLLVHLRGRERRSALDATGPDVVPLVLSTDLHDAIESFPDLVRTPRFADLASGEAMEFAGKAHYEMNVESQEGRPVRIVVTLGLRYAPWIFPDRVEEITTIVRSYLYARSPSLVQRICAGSLELEVKCMIGRTIRPFNMK